MKKSILALVCMLGIVTTAQASPLTDFSQGKAALDLTWQQSKIGGTYAGTECTFKSKGSLDWGVTVGLGNRMAVQYKNAYTKSADTLMTQWYGYTINASTWNQQYNLLYSLNQNCTLYTGLYDIRGRMDYVDASYVIRTDTKKIWQFGVIGQTKLADKVTLFGSIGVGKDLTDYSVGVAYKFAPQTEFNLLWHDTKVTSFRSQGGADMSLKNKGLGYGITYKF